ncbi:MAG: hypothetical protein ACRELG_30025 [Gemmataceae bacterium]
MNPPNPFTVDVRVFPAKGVKSLVWQNGKLMDWVSGNVEYTLNGEKRGPTVFYAYRFDAAVVSPSGKFVALYERLGTKAIILGPDRLFREVNRSFDHAHVYEYPIHFFRLADGREALAHCPESYCELQIENPATGERWSAPGTGRLQSMFHSRLAANTAGNRILSAGWVWHPLDVVRVFDLKPTTGGCFTLELRDECCNQGAEASSAVFNPDGQVIVASAKEAEDFLEDEPGERLRPGMIGVFDLDKQKLVSLASLEDEAGTLMPVGNNYVVGFFEHPKLIEIASGRVLCRWIELKTGQQSSSILWHKPLPPPLALDPCGRRFAVADERQITVVTLTPHVPEI